MTNEERDELRRDLEAARCPALANAVNEWPHLMTAELPELRSLLRREERLATMEAGVRAAERLTESSTLSPYGTFRTYGRKKLAAVAMKADYEALEAALKLLETEVPDGQG